MQSKKANDFAFLKKTISKVNKAMYRTSLDFPSFSPLNQSLITNRTFDNTVQPQKKSKEKVQIPRKESFNHHHKISDGVQIYLLPKLPFGSHKTYNEEADFVDNHFQFDSNSPDLPKKLESLQKKFQLFGRKGRKTGKPQENHARQTKSSEMYSFKTKTGFLYCPLAEQMIKIYDKNKQVLKNDEKETQKQNSKLFLSFKTQSPKKNKDRLSQRLYPARVTAETPSSLFYSSKYSILFNKDETSRPKTSLGD